MTTSFGALCTDFYINQKLSLKLDLPSSRETMLDLFARVRRELPEMDRFRRYEGEVALESPEQDCHYSWLALRDTSIRSGWVNPRSVEQAYRLHQLVLELVPYYLSVAPLDVHYLELVFGFDMHVEANRNQIVLDALLADSPLAALLDTDREMILDAQPFLGFCLNERCDTQAYVEVKTRTKANEVAVDRYDSQPISVFLTTRRYGPLDKVEDLLTTFGTLAGHAERLTEERIIPRVVQPIREMILSHPG